MDIFLRCSILSFSLLRSESLRIPSRSFVMGDSEMGTCLNNIGRLKLHFEEGMNKFLCTNIQTRSGCPIGSGVAINASASKHISKWDVVCPAGIDD